MKIKNHHINQNQNKIKVSNNLLKSVIIILISKYNDIKNKYHFLNS